LKPGPEGDHCLLFRTGSRVGALALTNVQEVMRPLPVESIAGAPAFVMGVSILRGAAAPVIDAARLLDDTIGATPNRFISLKIGSRSVCLAVDAVLDLRMLPTDHFHQVPPLLRDSSAALLSLIGTLDSELLMVLNSARMVPEEVWTSMQGLKSS